MRVSADLVVLLLWQVAAVSAKHGTIGMGIVMYNPVCAYACHDALSALYLNCTTFEDASMDGMEGMDMKVRKRMDMDGMEMGPMGTTSDDCYATDTTWLQTLSFCLEQKCGDEGVDKSLIEKGWQTLAANGFEVPAYQSVLPTSTPTVEVEADAMWLNMTSLVNPVAYAANRGGMAEFEYQEDLHVQFSVAIMVLTVGVTLLAGLYQWFSASSHGSMVPTIISKHLMLPALFNGRHQTPLPYQIGYAPSRIVSLMIFLYVLLNIIFSAAPYKSIQPNSWFSNTRSEIATYIANRTGVLSFANMALAILFAGRLNPLLHLSGLSQTTCLIFHRWSARVATVQAIIHSIIYTCTKYWSGGSAAYYAEAALPYYWWGIIATTTLSLGIGLSVLPIRLRQYELFLVSHIILAILSIVGCWYHIALRFANDWGYEVWLYIAIAFWGFERLSRLALIGYRNMGGSTTQAVAELTPNGDFIKLTVYPAKPWTFGPGQHAFLFLPSTMRFWESHPFSIATWDNGFSPASELPTAILPNASTSEDPEKDLTISAHPISSAASSNNIPSPSSVLPSITFLLRPQKGLTAHLHKYLQYSLSSSRKVPISVTLEGPYGHSANLNNCDAILCIGGGIGITSLLSYVQFFVFQRRSSAANFRPSRLVLNWSHTESGFDDVVRGMLPLDAEKFGVELVFTHTTAEGKGRINVGEAVKREVDGVKRLAVVVCAPPGFADEVRQAVVGVVGGVKVVDLHEESFAW